MALSQATVGASVRYRPTLCGCGSGVFGNSRDSRERRERNTKDDAACLILFCRTGT